MDSSEADRLRELEAAAREWVEARAGGRDTTTTDAKVREAMRAFRRAERAARRRRRKGRA